MGRPWRKVEGEILATFDTRTIAGRHVVFDHLTPRPHALWGESELRSWRVRRRVFYIDARGVLRARPVSAYRSNRLLVRDEVVRTLGARRVIVRDERPYWLEPTGSTYADGTLAYRQTRELDPRERAWWDALEDHERVFAQRPAVDERARRNVVARSRTRPALAPAMRRARRCRFSIRSISAAALHAPG